MGLLLSILNVLGFGHVTVSDDGFEVKRCLRSARFAWGEVEEVSGTLFLGYGSFNIVLSGEKELQLCFDAGTMALISAFMLKLPGFPYDWFSRIRDNGPDDFSLLWKRGESPLPEKSQGVAAAYSDLMRVLDPPVPEKTLDRYRVGNSEGHVAGGDATGRSARVLINVSIAVLALALTAYWEIVTKVRLANHSTATLMNARVGFFDGVLWTGNLAPGESVWVWEMVEDREVMLSYDQGGKKIEYSLGYGGAPAMFNPSVAVDVYDNGGIEMNRIPSLGSGMLWLLFAASNAVENMTDWARGIVRSPNTAL